MNDLCTTCRFACLAGCRKHMCATVRARMLATGRPVPKEPVQQAGPEPLGPDGEAGWLITWGKGLEKEFPPTPDGMREADMFGFYMASTGHTVSMAEMRRDIDGPVPA